MNETLLFQSATDAAQAVRRKEISSHELTETLLAWIEATNPALNAVVELRPEAALREATAADEATARGDDTGPLHGVPMTIKDSFNVAGMHTTWGNPAFADFVADSDGTVARRLRQAGAIIVGKTNVAFMLADFGQTANRLYGVTNNPWDTARTPGGSSGGAENQAAKAYSWALSPPRHSRLEDSHVGVVLDHEHAPVSSEVTALLSNAVDALARAGATVVEGWPDGVDPVQQYESFGFHVQSFFAFQQPSEDFTEFSEFVDHENRRMAARAAWNRYFNDIDVFLCPVNFTPPFPHDARPFEQRTITTPEGERPYNDQAFWVAHASLPGLPAVAAPIGCTPGGLPVGAQIVGPRYEDDTAITFAERLAGVVGGYNPPPL